MINLTYTLWHFLLHIEFVLEFSGSFDLKASTLPCRYKTGLYRKAVQVYDILWHLVIDQFSLLSFSLHFIGHNQSADLVRLRYSSSLRNHMRFHWSPSVGKLRSTPVSSVKTTELYEVCRWIIRDGTCIAAIAGFNSLLLRQSHLTLWLKYNWG